MSTPLVSICLPVLNAGRFLDARLDSIFAQTYTHWELIAVDNHSDDGTWERLQTAAAKEPRMRISQAPREGMYANWNNTLREARGEFVYVATADDTMDPRCLEVLVSLIRDCERPCIAQCGLTLIDDEGDALPEERQWPANTEWVSIFGEHFSAPHVRNAPLDGATVLVFGTVITSITQALFPREAFLKYGGFPNEFGSAGDMAWEGLLGFFYDVHFTPERLATWRLHDTQATALNTAPIYERYLTIGEWILGELGKHSPASETSARTERLLDYRRFSQIRHRYAGQGMVGRLGAVLSMFVNCPRFYSAYLLQKLGKAQGAQTDPVTRSRARALAKFLEREVETLPGVIISKGPLD